MKQYTLINEVNTYVKKFALHGRRVTFKINPPPENVAEFDHAEDAIKELIDDFKKKCKKSDKIGLTFTSDQFKEAPGYISFRDRDEISSSDIWNVLFSLFQSNEEKGVSIFDTFKIHFTRVAMPHGSGRRKAGFYNNFKEECHWRKGIVTIKNDDNLCLPRALVVGKALAEKDPLYNQIRRNIGKVQDRLTKDLIEKVGVKIPDHGAGLKEIQKFQDYFKDFKITIYKHGSRGREMIYEGENREASKKINILHFGTHYNLISSLTSAFACRYYCDDCHVPYGVKGRHRCQKICPACNNESVCEKEKGIGCEDCNRKFYNQKCFDHHKTTKLCQHVIKCITCFKVYDKRNRKKPHVCGEIFCKACKEHKPANHECYIQPATRKSSEKNYLYIFYDLETRQEREHSENPEVKIHEPNLCVVQKRCEKCIENESAAFCEKCGVRQSVIKDPDVIDKFMNYVLNVRKSYKNVCCIAHNAQGFDSQFVLKYILEKTYHVPNLIMRGTKIIQLTIHNVRFIDSLNYFPMALSALSKSFNLPCKKGYFPHLFNTEKNKNYIGKMPDKMFYSPDTMSEKEREKFLKWYDDQVSSDNIFEMEKEIVSYCVGDVTVLRQACLQFLRDFQSETKVNPFLEAVTIASACNLAFRRNFLKAETIGLIPPGGYRNRGNQSKIALEWLTTVENQRNIKIRHSGRGKEAVLNGMKVDGYFQQSKEIFEFHGCYYHGCPKCFPHQRDSPLHEDPEATMTKRYERTKDKTERLRSLGYIVHEMWECEYRKERLKIPQVKLIGQMGSLPLDPRDAFYGGRTGCTKLYKQTEDEEEIRYIDICSLYPFINKYSKYPIGHPEIYFGEDCKKLIGKEMDLTKVEGLIKCSVLPPTDLYHPVLPCKQNGKLIFSLCRTCSQNENKNECNHSDSERTLTGTWVVDEVKKAVSKGYQVLEVFEIWQYKVVQYDPELKTGGLFTEYINKFLKIKQEASGFPPDCITKEQKEKYIEEFFQAEGIKLDLEKIEVNPGLRSLGKLQLNNFWGRMGMRENMPRTAIVREPHELFKLLADPSVNVNTVQEINEEVVLVNWEYKEEAREFSPTVNVTLAAYTTAQARLKLYSYLEPLDRQVLYYDTDSVIYSYKEGQHKVATGSFLGEMTDELECYGHGSFITEFVSGGPKTYAYKVLSPLSGKISYVCKVKGLTLNFKASQIVNFDKLKEMVLNEREGEEVVVHSTNILRTKERDIVTAPVSKKFQINITKRRRVDDYDTEPFGYKKVKLM